MLADKAPLPRVVSMAATDPLAKVPVASRFASWAVVTALASLSRIPTVAPLLTVTVPDEGSAADCVKFSTPLETIVPPP